MKRKFKEYYSVLLVTTVVTSFLASFKTSSITIALPITAKELHVTLADVNWIVNAF